MRACVNVMMTFHTNPTLKRLSLVSFEFIAGECTFLHSPPSISAFPLTTLGHPLTEYLLHKYKTYISILRTVQRVVERSRLHLSHVPGFTENGECQVITVSIALT